MTLIGPHLAICEQRAAAKAEYTLRWPNHCRKCDGRGFIGGGMDWDTGYADADPCSRCTEQGLCPRCGVQALDEDGLICGSCGFNAEEDEGCPDGECECFLSMVEDWEARTLEENHADMVDWLRGVEPGAYDYAADDFAYQVYRRRGGECSGHAADD